MDTRLHPQINHIKYNDWDKSYDIWTSDDWHFHFNAITYPEFIQQVTKVVKDEVYRMTGDHFRFYMVDPKTAKYEHKCTTRNIEDIFKQLDQYILYDELKHTRYTIIENKDNGDIPIYLGFGDKLDYLTFKERMLPNENKEKVKRL